MAPYSIPPLDLNSMSTWGFGPGQDLVGWRQPAHITDMVLEIDGWGMKVTPNVTGIRSLRGLLKMVTSNEFGGQQTYKENTLHAGMRRTLPEREGIPLPVVPGMRFYVMDDPEYLDRDEWDNIIEIPDYKDEEEGGETVESFLFSARVADTERRQRAERRRERREEEKKRAKEERVAEKKRRAEERRIAEEERLADEQRVVVQTRLREEEQAASASARLEVEENIMAEEDVVAVRRARCLEAALARQPARPVVKLRAASPAPEITITPASPTETTAGPVAGIQDSRASTPPTEAAPALPLILVTPPPPPKRKQADRGEDSEQEERPVRRARVSPAPPSTAPARRSTRPRVSTSTPARDMPVASGSGSTAPPPASTPACTPTSTGSTPASASASNPSTIPGGFIPKIIVTPPSPTEPAPEPATLAPVANIQNSRASTPPREAAPAPSRPKRKLADRGEEEEGAEERPTRRARVSVPPRSSIPARASTPSADAPARASPPPSPVRARRSTRAKEAKGKGKANMTSTSSKAPAEKAQEGAGSSSKEGKKAAKGASAKRKRDLEEAEEEVIKEPLPAKKTRKGRK